MVFGLLYSLSVLIVAWLVFEIQEEEILRNAGSESRHRSELALKEFKAQLELAQRDILLLSSSPSLKHFVEEANDENRTELSALFEQYLSTREEYFQVRYLDAQSGMELIRLDKDQGAIIQKADSALQNKRNREYFEETIKLERDAFYFSEINLNREHNQVSIPEIKTLRVASPIYKDESQLKGVVVINIDLQSWLTKIRSLTSDRSEMIILKDNDEYVLHPNDSLSFGMDRKHGHLSSVDLGLAMTEADTAEYFKGSFQTKEMLYTSQSYTYNKSPERSLSFIDYIEEAELFASITEKRREIVGQSIMIMFIGLFIIFLLAKRLIRPLLRMKDEIAKRGTQAELNLTDSKRDDELGSLAKSFEELTLKLQEEAAMSLEAMKRAEKLSEEKEDFLANFSHELRTPLNSILGMSEVLTENDPSPKQKPVLNTLKYAVLNLRALIGDVLDSSKIDQGDIELKKELLILPELAQNLILSHKPEADRKALDLSFEIDDAIPARLEGDYLRLYQVLNNLLSNAVKFTSEGGVVLRISQKDDLIRFEVIDSGPGIPLEDRERIFEKYKQSESGRRNTQGLGLGLNIARNLVELMGGELLLEDSKKGSHFSFALHLPALKEEAEPKGQRIEAKRKILCVDDIAINRFTLSQLLEPEGYEVLEAESCAEAKKILETEALEVVIMDLRMPEVDGFECIRSMQSDQINFIALSANLGDIEKAKLEGLGVRYAMEKPVNKNELKRYLDLLFAEQSGLTEKLRVYFEGASDEKLEKAKQVMIKDIADAAEALKSEPKQEKLDDIIHKLKPSLTILSREDILKLDASKMSQELSDLSKKLESTQ